MERHLIYSDEKKSKLAQNLTLKNHKFYPIKLLNTEAILPSHELDISAKFHEDWPKTVNIW